MIITRTPFRVSFFGGGTDYPGWYREHGGAVLATTIDKYCYITCRYLPPFFEHKHIRFIGVEAGGKGRQSGNHASRFMHPPLDGIVQGYKSYFLQSQDGQIKPTHSIAAGLDYAGIGPELAYHYDKGKIKFFHVNDKEVLKAFKLL